MTVEVKTCCSNNPEAGQPELILTDDERAEFESLIADQPLHNPLLRHPNAFFLELKAKGRKLPERLLRKLDEFKLTPATNKWGHIVIRNLPRDAKRTTPRSHRDPICDSKTVGEWVNMYISNQVGDTFTLANEYDGRYPNPIAPQEDKKKEASSASSESTLGWHQDLIAMGEARATWLALTCIKAAPAGTGATTIASLFDALPRISPAAREILRQPIFTVDAPASCKGAIRPLITAILGGGDTEPYMTYQDGGTRLLDPDNEAATMAMQEFVGALNSSRRDIYLQPGDTLIFRNGPIGWNTAHGRSIFTANFDNTAFVDNRYLVRSYVQYSIVPIQKLCYPNSRVLVPTSLYRAAYA